VKSDGVATAPYDERSLDDRRAVVVVPDSTKVSLSDRSDDKQQDWSVDARRRAQAAHRRAGARRRPRIVIADCTRIALVINENTSFHDACAKPEMAPDAVWRGNFAVDAEQRELVIPRTAGNLIVNGQRGHERRGPFHVPGCSNGSEKVRYYSGRQD